jgi:hypothetical protein
MSIAAKMHKAGYMPKARNKSREDKEVFDRQMEGGREDKASAEEKEAGLVQGPSAADKAASAMWLKNRLKGKPQIAAPGTTNSNIASMTGSRYGTGGRLPYKMPENMMSPNKAETKKVDFGPTSNTSSKNEAKTEDNEAKPEVPIDKAEMDNGTSRYGERKDFVKFMRGAKFANKPNRLVRQCVHCCILYSTSHVCKIANVSFDMDAADYK